MPSFLLGPPDKITAKKFDGPFNFCILKNRLGAFFNFLRLLNPTFYVIAIISTGCKNPQKHKIYTPIFAVDSTSKKTIVFGVPNTIYYDETIKLVSYLNNHFGGSVRIRCIASKSLDAYLEQLNDCKFDFTIANGAAALEGSRKGYSIAAKYDSDTSYYGVIFVNKDSGIVNVKDLKGKTISLVARSALAGSKMPLLYLHQHGVNVNKDLKFLYPPSFESVILNVYLGKSSAGAAAMPILRKFIEQRPEILKKVSLKWSTPYLPDLALLINNGMDQKTTAKLLTLLLTMHRNKAGLAALKDIGIPRFAVADSSSYESTKAFSKEYKSMIYNTDL